MDFREHDEGAYVVLEPEGRLNLVTAPPVRSRIADLVQRGRANIVVDLGAVDTVDSSGIGALIAGLKAAREVGGDLRLARAGDQVLAVLKLTNLDRILAPYPSAEEAGHDW